MSSCSYCDSSQDKYYRTPQPVNRSAFGVSDCRENGRETERERDKERERFVAHYKGSGDVIDAAAGKKAYFVLENQKNSGVDVCVDETLITNFSALYAVSKAYLCTSIKGTLPAESDFVSNTDTHVCCNTPAASVYSGTAFELRDHDYCEVLSIPAYNTFKNKSCEKIILAPGKYYIIELSGSDSSKEFKYGCSFCWTETGRRRCEE